MSLIYITLKIVRDIWCIAYKHRINVKQIGEYLIIYLILYQGRCIGKKIKLFFYNVNLQVNILFTTSLSVTV